MIEILLCKDYEGKRPRVTAAAALLRGGALIALDDEGVEETIANYDPEVGWFDGEINLIHPLIQSRGREHKLVVAAEDEVLDESYKSYGFFSFREGGLDTVYLHRPAGRENVLKLTPPYAPSRWETLDGKRHFAELLICPPSYLTRLPACARPGRRSRPSAIAAS